MGARGVLVASAAAALFLAGVPGASHAEESAAEAKVKCEGVNACKGHSDCQTATNGCKGQNSCAGKGFVMMTKAECEAARAAAEKKE
jgi:hypothetical protein